MADPNAPTFSPADAQTLVVQAQSAPLDNMEHAATVSTALQRFQQWYGHAINEIETVESRIEAAVKAAVAKVRAEFEPAATLDAHAVVPEGTSSEPAP